MKKLTGLIIILAVLVLGGYYGMGVLTENTIKRDVEVINQTNGLFADVQDYKRGWYRSYATIKWRLHVPERIEKDANGQSQAVPAQDYQVDMPIKIYHGPFIFANHKIRFGMGIAESDIELPKEYLEQFNSNFSKDSVKPKLVLSIFVNYFNKSTLGITLPYFKLIAKEGNGQFEWKGMRTTTSVSSKMDRIYGKIIVDGMNVNKDEQKVSVGKVKSIFDLHQTPGGLYLGEASFSLPSFTVTNKNQKMFEINKFSLSSDSNIEKSLFSSHLSVSVHSVFANGDTYGPADLEVSLRDLDADVLAAINEQANALQNGTEADRQKAMLAMLPQLPKLLSKGAKFEISKLSVKIPQGMVEGSLSVALPNNIASSNPFEIYQLIKGDAKLKVPSVLVKMLMQQAVLQKLQKQPELQQTLVQEMQQGAQTQAVKSDLTSEQLASMYSEKQLATMQQNGLIAVQGTDYYIEMKLDQGKITVNGNPFDLSMVKF